jgi:hypothetical protein
MRSAMEMPTPWPFSLVIGQILPGTGCYLSVFQWSLPPPRPPPLGLTQECYSQRPCITRRWTHAVICLGWLDMFWKWDGGGSCKGCAVPLVYAQSCPAVIWGVLQLWRRRIAMGCTLSTAFTELSISTQRQTSRDPYFSLVTVITLRHLCMQYAVNLSMNTRTTPQLQWEKDSPFNLRGIRTPWCQKSQCNVVQNTGTPL